MTPSGRRRLRRGVVILPSAFTVGNLFLGVWAIVAASRGEYVYAGWLIVLAAVADMLDGRIARFTATGSAFGEELDSLVDAISFGVAPALIMYFLFFREGSWSWLLAFLYIVAAIFRLARFNIEQAGTAKSAFHGLPSPIAGSTIATYYTFTRTDVFAALFPHLSIERTAAIMMIVVAGLMVSNVLYPVVPRFGTRTWSGRLTILLFLSAFIAAFVAPDLYFFPMCILYITIGLVRTVVLGALERLPEKDPLVDEDEDEGGVRELDYEDISPRPGLRRDPRTLLPEEEV